ncbi:hypothetical protein WJX77_008882 [Trebouxia sp. C0004]
MCRSTQWDSAWFKRFCGTIRPGFVPLCASTMRTTALDNKHAKKTDQGEVSSPRHSKKHEAELTGSKATAGQTAAVKIIKSKVFWRDLDILTPIAKPFNQVCQAMQGHESGYAHDSVP